MNHVEQAKLLSIAAKFAKAEANEVRNDVLREFYEYFSSPNYELEKAKLLSIASKFAKSEANEVRDALLDTFKQLESRLVIEDSIPGLIGPAGPQGPVGPQGERGEQGIQGLAGLRGEKGDPGPQGPQGKQGIRGQRGERGPKGDKGDTGRPGLDGRDGKDGKDGAPGIQGIQGPEGPRGLQGFRGEKGDKGDKGDPGSDANIEPLQKEFETFKDIIDKRISRLAFSFATGAVGSSAGSGEVRLNRLDDVHYPSVDAATEGQALVWDNTLKKWKAGNAISDSSGGFSSEVIDYGSIVSAVDIELNRDYGTL